MAGCRLWLGRRAARSSGMVRSLVENGGHRRSGTCWRGALRATAGGSRGVRSDGLEHVSQAHRGRYRCRQGASLGGPSCRTTTSAGVPTPGTRQDRAKHQSTGPQGRGEHASGQGGGTSCARPHRSWRPAPGPTGIAAVTQLAAQRGDGRRTVRGGHAHHGSRGGAVQVAAQPPAQPVPGDPHADRVGQLRPGGPPAVRRVARWATLMPGGPPYVDVVVSLPSPVSGSARLSAPVSR
jgi:hypothetical protein